MEHKVFVKVYTIWCVYVMGNVNVRAEWRVVSIVGKWQKVFRILFEAFAKDFFYRYTHTHLILTLLYWIDVSFVCVSLCEYMSCLCITFSANVTFFSSVYFHVCNDSAFISSWRYKSVVKLMIEKCRKFLSLSLIINISLSRKRKIY